MVIFNSFLLNYQRVFLLPMAIPWQRPGLISYSAVVEPDALRRAAALKALDGQGAPARSSKLFHAVPSCQQWLFHVSRQWFIGFIKNPYNYIHIYIYGRCRNYRTEVEEYEGTVIYRTLLFYNSL